MQIDESLYPNGQVPEGETTFDLRLGPILIRINALPTPWTPFVEDHYVPFGKPVNPSETPDLSVTCESGEGLFVELPEPGGATRLELEERGPGQFEIQSHWQSGSVDLSTGLARTILTNREHLRFRMSIENFLRVSGQLMLLEHGAFLMHTAGILDDGGVYLFFGPSGAGKSTATMNSAPREALSDDMVLLDVSGDTATAVAVPFYGAFPPEERKTGRWPVRGAFRLRQSPDVRLEKLSPARSIATVSASVPFVHELGIRHEGLTRLVSELCSKIPVYDLYLRKSPDFWDVIKQTVG